MVIRDEVEAWRAKACHHCKSEGYHPKSATVVTSKIKEWRTTLLHLFLYFYIPCF